MSQAIPATVSNKLANMGVLCALLVAVLHVDCLAPQGTLAWWVRQFLKEGVCQVAVPFFFIAAGYFLAGHMQEVGWWPRELKKRVRSLLIPYLVWALLYGVFMIGGVMLANHLSHASLFATLDGPWGGVVLKVFGLCIEVPQLWPLWFVRNLLFLCLLAPLLKGMMARHGVFFLVLLGILYGVLYPFRYVASPWATFITFFFSLEGLFYFALGIALRQGMAWTTLIPIF